MKKYIMPILLFNAGLIYMGWFFTSDTTADGRDFATEGVKAIAWMVTAPVCEVNGFCHEIKSTSSAGKFVSAAIRKEANIIHGDYSQVETTTGSYVVKGKVDGTQFEKTMNVTLHIKKGELENVLCINDTNCFLVPFNKNKTGTGIKLKNLLPDNKNLLND